MTYEEKKEIEKAVNVLKLHCDKNIDVVNGCNLDCGFLKHNTCVLSNFPCTWDVPKVSRWTPEDVALAKALKAVGAKVIYNTLGSVYWRTDDVHTFGKLPNGAFESIKRSESFSIDDIIKEAEEV